MATTDQKVQQLEQQLQATQQQLAGLLAQQAQQAAATQPPRSPREKPLVDTRAIGKPGSFSGDLDETGKGVGESWSLWSFTFRAYAGALSGEMRIYLEKVQANCETMTFENAKLQHDELEMSCQLFYILAMLLKGRALTIVQRAPEQAGFEAWRMLCIEFEPRLPARFQGMLQSILSPSIEGDQVTAIYAWEKKCEEYEKQSGEKIGEQIRMAVLISHLVSARLRTHLSLQAARLATYGAMRKEAVDFLRSQAAFIDDGGSRPMDLSALEKGKGKGKGKKGKKGKEGKGGKSRPCFYCDKTGHNKSECWDLQKDRKAEEVKPDKAGKFAGQPVDKKTGRRKEKGEVTLLEMPEEEDAEGGFVFALTEETGKATGKGKGTKDKAKEVEEDVGEIAAMTAETEMIFDTGAAKSCCPSSFAPETELKATKGTKLNQADGTPVKHFGGKRVEMTIDGRKVVEDFDVKQVSKPILAASSVVESGGGVWLYKGNSRVIPAAEAEKVNDSMTERTPGAIALHVRRGVFTLPVRTGTLLPMTVATAAQEEAGGDSGEPLVQEADSEEARLAFTKTAPKHPTDDAREQHLASGHVPFRSWCTECVEGQAQEEHHKTGAATENTQPMISMDYCFLSRDNDDNPAIVLVMVLAPHGAVGACQVLRKGAEEYVVDCVCFYLDVWGVKRCTLKADNEPAIQALLAAVRKKRIDETVIEQPPIYSHQSNGPAENAVKRIEGKTRTLVFALEKRLGVRISARSIVLPWIVRHVAFMITRCSVKADGRSPWCRLRGKEWSLPMVEFGEAIDYKIQRPTAKLESRWSTGLFFGRRDESGEVVVGTPTGIEFARSMRRRAEEQRWSKEEYSSFIGVPWNPRGLEVTAQPAPERQRRKYVTKAVVAELGMTDGCGGCLGVATTHTARCKRRFDEIFLKEATDIQGPMLTGPVSLPPPMTSQSRSSTDGAGKSLPAPAPMEQTPAAAAGQGQTRARPEQTSPISPASPAKKKIEFSPPAVEEMLVEPVEAPMEDVAQELFVLYPLCEEEIEPPVFEDLLKYAGKFHDYYTGEELPKDLVIEGIRTELAEMQDFSVFEWRRAEERKEGEKMITTKMFHKKKSDTEVRSRIVARQYADGAREPEYHAGTPPTWALKLVISRAASRGTRRQIGIHDISVAFFHAWLAEGVWVKPPPEMDCEGWLWWVVKALYGMRESSKAFQDLVTAMFEQWAWTVLKTVPCLAYNSSLDTLCGFHGDDFYTEGEPDKLDQVDKMIEETFKAKKLPRVGPQASPHGLVLRRLLVWNDNGFFLQPDPKHFENLGELLGVTGAKPAPTPMSKATGRDTRDALDPLARQEAIIYRRGVGTALYVAPDRFDLQFACKVLASDMQSPMKISMARLRRFVRYMLGTKDYGLSFLYQDTAAMMLVTVYVDGDWSGDVATCKSTSAGAVLLGTHCLESWSVTQKLIALSSAESEFYAMGSGCARGITVKNVLTEIANAEMPDTVVKMEVHTDSTAARGMLHRKGVGRVRHLATRYLWIQDSLREGIFAVIKVASKENCADAGTKPLDEEPLKNCCVKIGLGPRSLTSFAAVLLLTAAGAEARGEIAVYTTELTTIQQVAGEMLWCLKCVVTMACVAAVAAGCAWRAAKAEQPSQPTKRTRRATRTVGVQGPVHYKRHLTQPRFQPLGALDWGAWSD